MRSRPARAALGFALGLLLAGAACAAPPTPLLWKISKGDNAVWLLGSMHMLKDNDYPLSPDVDAAYKDVDRLVFEISPAEMESPATVAIMLKHGMQQDPAHTLKDDLPPATWNQAVAYGAKNGLPEAALLKFEPWMMAMTMVALETQKMGMNPESGLDKHFMDRASTDRKSTSGLETADQQLAIFYTSPIRDQQEFLKQTLEEVADFRKEMDNEHDLWRRGDGDALYADAKKEFADYPALYQKLVVQRNRNWVPQIEKMLADGHHHTLVIVGGLHLVGPDGVVRQLQAKGYAIQRVCTDCRNAR
jgi:uncharacterized protein YbaP (TraB family)